MKQKRLGGWDRFSALLISLPPQLAQILKTPACRAGSTMCVMPIRGGCLGTSSAPTLSGAAPKMILNNPASFPKISRGAARHYPNTKTKDRAPSALDQ